MNMFNNLTKEIILYSLIPVAILAVINLFILFLSKSSDKNAHRFNYLIKIGLLLIIGLVLPLILGYTIWIGKNYITSGTIASNIGYMILLGVLIVALMILLIVISTRLYKSFGEVSKENVEEYE